MLAPVQTTRRLRLNLMVIGNYNPRRRAGLQQQSLEELAQSIKAHGGFIQMPLLRPVTIEGIARFEVVAGQRRIKAAILAFGEDAEVEVAVREMTDLEAVAASLAENIDREKMSPAEEAEGAARMLAQCDGDREATAKAMGWPLGKLDDRLKLMACSDLVRDRLADDKLSLGVAEIMAGLPKAKQDELIAGFDAAGKVPTIDEFRSQVMVLTKSLDAAIFDKSDCASCAHNSAQQRAMFATGLEEGHCLNGACYEQKTTAALESKAESLRDTYQTVRIVRPGDQFRIQPLASGGPLGVGEEQATACRTCKDFGVAVSGMPDKLGRVAGPLCFNLRCHEEKVRARVDAETEAAAKAKADAEAQSENACETAAEGAEANPSGEPAKAGAKSAKASQKSAPKPAQPAKKPAVTVTLSAAVTTFRDQLYATVVATEVLKSPDRGFAMLMALACQSRLSTVSSQQADQVVKKLLPENHEGSRLGNLGERFADVMACPPERVAHFASRIAATAAAALQPTEAHSMIAALQPDWNEHFVLDESFLTLLTKTEIQAVAEELQIVPALGDAGKNLFTKKKDEIIKTVLGLKDFNYRGAMPRMLKPGFGKSK